MTNSLLPSARRTGATALAFISMLVGSAEDAPDPSPLAAVEAQAPKEWKDPAAIAASHARAQALVETNTLRSGEEFRRAAVLFDLHLAEFRIGRLAYELRLAAAASGDEAAETMLAASWDTLLTLMGRPMRFDFWSQLKNYPDSGELDAAPACVQSVWRDPKAARAAAAPAADNAEIKALVDADQDDRKAPWDGLSAKEIEERTQRDRTRNARVRAIVAAGDIHTANDHSRASLVLQHSQNFAGFQLAHELAVASLILGDRAMGRWLVAATYDRMLGTAGLDQRFGTQFGPAGLRRVDEAGICDNERQVLGCRTLAATRTIKSPGH